MKVNPNSLSNDLNHVLEHTRELWDELRGERVFITGGTGFFGCWLLESFLWANDRLNLGATIAVLTRSPDSFHKKVPHLAGHDAVTVIEGDVRTFSFPVGEFSHIIHAATESSAKLNVENPLLMLDTILVGTRHTLDFAQACCARKFLLTSSGAVYGKQPPELTHIPEDYVGAPDPLDSKSAYGEGKRLAEHLCMLYARQSELDVKIARCFAFVGPYLPLDIHFAIGNFIRDGLNGGPIVIKGDGTPKRSYLYSADLAIWLWKILFCGKELRPYNVGSEFPINIRDLAKIIAGSTKPEAKVYFTNKPISSTGLPEHYVPSTKVARDELGLKEWINLRIAIDRTNKWYSKFSQ